MRNWPDGIWADRYRSIPISDEPAAQVDRLRYVLAQGVKEGLVAKVDEWPGISMLDAVLEGKPIRGTCYQACGGQMTSRKGEVCSARVHMKRRRFRPGDEGARCVLFRCAR